MTELQEYLKNLRETDPVIASILEEYKEIENVYNSSMESIGIQITQRPDTINTAAVTLSIKMSPSTAQGQLIVGG